MASQPSKPSVVKALAQALGETSTWHDRLPFSRLMRYVRQRMSQLDIDQLPGYQSYLEAYPAEMPLLLRTITGNYPTLHDQEAQQVGDWLPTKLDRSQPHHRFWVCGVGNGGFAYHLLMLLMDRMGNDASEVPFRIFGTDSIAAMVTWARWSHLSAETVGRLPQSWQKTYFKLAEQGYYFDRRLRQALAFAQHHPLEDPPYLRQDGIFCLLDPDGMPLRQWNELQGYWYDSLKPGGLLWLQRQRRPPEAIDRSKFRPDEQIAGLYWCQPQQLGSQVAPAVSSRQTRQRPLRPATFPPTPSEEPHSWRGLVHKRLVEEFGPPYMVFDASGRLVERDQQAVKWLTDFQFNESPQHVLNFIHPDLRDSMRSLLRAWQQTQQNQEGDIVQLQMHGQLHRIRLSLRSLTRRHQHLLVVFQENRLPTPLDPHHESQINILGIVDPTSQGFRPLLVTDQDHAENLSLRQRNRSLHAQVSRLQHEIERLKDDSQSLGWLRQHMRLGTWRWYAAEARLEGDDGFHEIFSLDETSDNLTWQALIPPQIAEDVEEWQDFQAWLQGQSDTPPRQGICFSVIAPNHGLRCLYLGASEPQPAPDDPDEAPSLAGFVIDITALAVQNNLSTDEVMAEVPPPQPAPKQQEYLRLLSHELRTPLNHITSLLTLIEDTSEPDDRAYMFRLLQRSADHLRYLCENILTEQTLSDSWLRITPERVDIRELLDDLRLRFSRDALSKDLSFEYQIEDEVPAQLETDPHRLQQILNNLLSNAIKNTRAGGIRMQVLVRNGPSATDHYLIFRITDTGPGMTRPQLERLVSSETQRIPRSHRGGSGLGLYVVQQILRVWGGWFDVESLPEQGTTFLVGIPLPAETIPPGVASISEPTPAAHDQQLVLAGNWRMLYVDDSDVNRLYVSALGQSHRLYVDTVSSGEQALKAMREKRYESLLIDLSLLDTDTVEVVRQIRQWKEPFFDCIPILGVSANQQYQQTRPKDFDLLDDLLIKPLMPQPMRQLLEKHVQRYLTQQLTYRHTLDLERVRQDFGQGDRQTYRELLGQLLNQLDQIVEELNETPSLLPELGRRLDSSMRVLNQPDQAIFCRAVYLLAQADPEDASPMLAPFMTTVRTWQGQMASALDEG